MMALLRLALLSFAFGVFCELCLLCLRFAFLLLFPFGEGLPHTLRERLPCSLSMPSCGKLSLAITRLLHFFSDVAKPIFLAALYAVFLYWQADGKVRLFSILLSALGLFVTAQYFSRRMTPFLHRLVFGVWYAALFLLLPIGRLVLRLSGKVFAVLQKIFSFFIKHAKRYDTIRVAYWYRRSAIRRMRGKSLYRSLMTALRQNEEGKADG